MLLDVPNDIIKNIIKYFLPTQKSFLLMAGVCIECQISDIKHLNSKLKDFFFLKKKKPIQAARKIMEQNGYELQQLLTLYKFSP